MVYFQACYLSYDGFVRVIILNITVTARQAIHLWVKMGHLWLTWLTLVSAWISNYIHYKVGDENTYPFLNFNGATVEIYEWISNDHLLIMGFRLIHFCKRGHKCLQLQPFKLQNWKYGSKQLDLIFFGCVCIGGGGGGGGVIVHWAPYCSMRGQWISNGKY